MKLFIDTWGWVTIYSRREPHHQEFSQFQRLPVPLAKETIKLLEIAHIQNYLTVEWISPARFEAAKALRLKFGDKPRISFTDLTSIVVMTELGITQVATADAHFTHVGLGFQLIP